MVRISVVSVIAGLLASVAPALAADPVAPATQTGPSWTGFYIGVHTGVGAENLGYTELPVPLVTTDSTAYRLGDQNFVYGVHGGFDYQFAPRWVGGIELDYTQRDSEFAPFASGGFGNLAEIKSSYSASGRLGYLFTPETLVYARVGYSGTRLETEEGLFGTSSSTVGGLLVGAGAESFLWRNLTGRVDLSYADPGGDYENSDFEAFEPRGLLVTTGLSWRFGANENAHEVAPAPEMSFNGFYIGASGSYGFGQTEFDIDQPGASIGPFADQSEGAGLFAGYDVRFGSSWVGGIEAEASYVNYEFRDPDLNTLLALDGPTVFATVDASFAVSGRLGYMATGSTLAYVKAGYAGLLTEANEDFFALDGGDQKLLGAYQLGAGIETAVTERVSLRIEGLYVKAVDDLTVTNSQLEQNTIKPSTVTATFGLAYRF